MRRKLTAILVLATALALAAPVAAITTGQPDDNEHPYVGQLLFYVPDAVDSRFTDPGGWYTCTGTLLSPTVIVTAGHCTFGVGLDGVSTTDGGKETTAAEGGDGGNDIWIHFGEVANYDGFPPSGAYIPDDNQGRYDDRVEWLDDPANGWHRGRRAPAPAVRRQRVLPVRCRRGRARRASGSSTAATAVVAGLNYLEKYRSTARNEQRFEAVGYGLEKVLPIGVEGGDTRRKAEPKLNSLNGNPRDTYIVLSNNKATGGTCFGDSGGPTFDNTTSNLVVAVTSFGISPNCTGIGGAYRLDQPDDHGVPRGIPGLLRLASRHAPQGGRRPNGLRPPSLFLRRARRHRPAPRQAESFTTSSRTAAAEWSRAAFSSGVSEISITFCMPPSPRTTGTPTKRPS